MEDLMAQKKFEIMLDMAVKKYEKEINSLKQEILGLKQALSFTASEIEHLKHNFNSRQATPQYVEQRIEPQPIMAEKPKPRIVDVRPNEEKEANPSPTNGEGLRPRYGDYKSDDVSIEKFFYFGNKR